MVPVKKAQHGIKRVVEIQHLAVGTIRQTRKLMTIRLLELPRPGPTGTVREPAIIGHSFLAV
jgi:hypothetical protein